MISTNDNAKSQGLPSFSKKHILHFQRWPPSTNVTNGLMYVRQRLQRAMTVSDTTGTGSYVCVSQREKILRVKHLD